MNILSDIATGCMLWCAVCWQCLNSFLFTAYSPVNIWLFQTLQYCSNFGIFVEDWLQRSSRVLFIEQCFYWIMTVNMLSSYLLIVFRLDRRVRCNCWRQCGCQSGSGSGNEGGITGHSPTWWHSVHLWLPSSTLPSITISYSCSDGSTSTTWRFVFMLAWWELLHFMAACIVNHCIYNFYQYNFKCL